MQKKLIALAVAGLVSAPAFAQSNVQIYGVMDLGFRSLSGSEEIGSASKLKRRNAIDNDGQSSSRIGFRGTEDLGNGLKAFFTIEQGLDSDVSAAGGNRQIFVGLEGGFGRVWMGRDFNPSRALVSGLDPFGATGIGNNQQIFQQQTRYDNAIMYRSPNFGGLTVTAAYSTRVEGEDRNIASGAADKDSKGWSITPVYKNGPLTVGFGYEKYSEVGDGVTATNVDDRKRWNLGGSYNFGVVDLRAAYGQTKDDLVNGQDVKRKSWMLAGVVPVTEAGSVLVSYTRTKIDTDVAATDGGKASQWALGYSHNLSKRTAVYATYAKISTNSEAEGRYALNTSNPGASEGTGNNVASYTSGFNVGVRHNF